MNFIENESPQKLRGGYYTPPDLAQFLVRWIKEIGPRSILEPSCGDGAFISALAKVGGFKGATLTGFEIDPDEAAKARRRARECKVKADISSADFLRWSLDSLEWTLERPPLQRQNIFDAVIGNPPFVRYQYLPSEFQGYSQRIFDISQLHFTKHTNAWVPFVIASMELLKPGGRLAMVVPAEIIHVMHAQSLRSYLGAQCSRIVIVDPEEIWFSETLQGAVLLMAQKKTSPIERNEGVGIYPVRDRQFTHLAPAAVFTAPRPINGATVAGKWTRALLSVSTRELFDELEAHIKVHRFNEIAAVDVGIVTGANKFFLVDDKTVERFGLQKWAHPMFGRSEHCPGIIYDNQQHQENARIGHPTNFIWFQSDQAIKDTRARAYVQLGERQNLHTRFKCRVRSPWYAVPSVYATEVGMLKRCHHIPRLILNRAGAYTTDTAYRIRSKASADLLVACFLNPLTALSAELEGRHYGGGVLELVPSEIEKLLIPLPTEISFDLKRVDAAVRVATTEELLDRHGGQILGALGISKSKQGELLNAWSQMRHRRHRTSTEEQRIPAN
jgi:adenine-specific DNA-methyltransferase